MPRGNDPYQEIKRKLCKAFEPPFKQKLDALLTITDAGDERPSEFGLELQRLLSGATAEDLLKRIFLRSICPSIVTAITASLKADFNTLVAAADEAWTVSEASRATTASVLAATRQGQASRRGARGGRQRGSWPTGTGRKCYAVSTTNLATRREIAAQLAPCGENKIAPATHRPHRFSRSRNLLTGKIPM